MILQRVSFDPGEVRIGVALWDERAVCTGMYTKSREELDEFLDTVDTKDLVEIICESYRIRPGNKGNFNSEAPTIQVIGQIRDWARRKKIPCIMQQPNILKNTAKWAGMTLPKGHLPDHLSAYLHGYHRQYNLGMIKSRALEDEQNDSGL